MPPYAVIAIKLPILVILSMGLLLEVGCSHFDFQKRYDEFNYSPGWFQGGQLKQHLENHYTNEIVSIRAAVVQHHLHPDSFLLLRQLQPAPARYR